MGKRKEVVILIILFTVIAFILVGFSVAFYSVDYHKGYKIGKSVANNIINDYERNQNKNENSTKKGISGDRIYNFSGYPYDYLSNRCHGGIIEVRFSGENTIEISGYGDLANLKLGNYNNNKVEVISIVGSEWYIHSGFSKQFPNLRKVYLSSDYEIADGAFPKSFEIEFAKIEKSP